MLDPGCRLVRLTVGKDEPRLPTPTEGATPQARLPAMLEFIKRVCCSPARRLSPFTMARGEEDEDEDLEEFSL